MCQWVLRETASCICGQKNQTAHHIVYHHKALQPPNSLDDLVPPGPEGVCWLDRLVGIAWGPLLIRTEKTMQQPLPGKAWRATCQAVNNFELNSTHVCKWRCQRKHVRLKDTLLPSFAGIPRSSSWLTKVRLWLWPPLEGRCSYEITHVAPINTRRFTLRMWRFGSVANSNFLLLFLKHVVSWICCVFHDNGKVHSACKASTHLRFTFLSCLKQNAF